MLSTDKDTEVKSVKGKMDMRCLKKECSWWAEHERQCVIVALGRLVGAYNERKEVK